MLVRFLASTGTVVSSPWMRSAASTWARINATRGASVAVQAPIQSAKVETSSSMPSRANVSLWRFSGRCWPNFASRMVASSSGPARPRGMTWNGAGTCVMASQTRQAKRSRTVWITLNWRGITSSVSVTSSPSLDSLP